MPGAKTKKDSEDDRMPRRPGLDSSKEYRWSLSKASMEFNCDKNQLAKKVRRANLLPGPDGFYATGQIIKALFGDVEKERARKLAADANRSEIADQKLRKRLVDRDKALAFIVAVCMKVRGIIMASDLDEIARNDILAELQAGFDQKQVTKEICPDEAYEDLLEAGAEDADE